MNDIIQNIVQWGTNKGILSKGTIAGQYKKLQEETVEIGDALDDIRKHAMSIECDNVELKRLSNELDLEIGDAFVVLVLLAKMHDTNIQDCVAKTFTRISGRKGQMIDGVFVKEIA